MSAHALSYAFSSSLPPLQKLCLIKLCDNAGFYGEFTIDIDGLSEFCGIENEEAIKIIDEMIKINLIRSLSSLEMETVFDGIAQDRKYYIINPKN